MQSFVGWTFSDKRKYSESCSAPWPCQGARCTAWIRLDVPAVHIAACSDECALGRDYDIACPTGAIRPPLAWEGDSLNILRLGKYGRWVLQVQRVTKQQVTCRQAVVKLMLAIVSAELSLDLQIRRHGQCANADSWSVFARMFPVMCMSGLSRSCDV